MDMLLLRKSILCLALPGSGGIQDKGLAQHGNSFVLSPRRRPLHFTVDDTVSGHKFLHPCPLGGAIGGAKLMSSHYKAGSITWSENCKASFSFFTF